MASEKCGNTGNYGGSAGKTCVRTRGHLGLHRDTVRLKPMGLGTNQWGDNEGTPARW